MNPEMISARVELSPAGRARREAMLEELLAAVGGELRRKRRRRRVAGIACLLLFLCGGAWMAISLTNSGASRQFDRGSIAGHTVTGPIIVRVDTNPQVIDRYRAAQPRRLVERVNDEELLRALTAIDRPAGLVRIGDEVRLTVHVTDDELKTVR